MYCKKERCCWRIFQLCALEIGMLEGFETEDTYSLEGYTAAITLSKQQLSKMNSDFSGYIALLSQRKSELDKIAELKAEVTSKNIKLKDLTRTQETLDRQYLDQTGYPKSTKINIHDWSLAFFFISYAILSITTCIVITQMSTEKLQTAVVVGGTCITIGLLFFGLIRTFG